MDYFENLKKRFVTETLFRSLTTGGNALEAARQTAVNQGTQAINSIKQSLFSPSTQQPQVQPSQTFKSFQPTTFDQTKYTSSQYLPQTDVLGTKKYEAKIPTPTQPTIKREDYMSVAPTQPKAVPFQTFTPRVPEAETNFGKFIVNKGVIPLDTGMKKLEEAWTNPGQKIWWERALDGVEGVGLISSIPNEMIIQPVWDSIKLGVKGLRTGQITQQDVDNFLLSSGGQKGTIFEAFGTNEDEFGRNYGEGTLAVARFLDFAPELINIPGTQATKATKTTALAREVKVGREAVEEAGKISKASKAEKAAKAAKVEEAIVKYETKTGKALDEATKADIRKTVEEPQTFFQRIREKISPKTTDKVTEYMEAQIKKQAKEEAFNASKVGQFLNKIGNAFVDYTLPIERAVKNAIAKGIGVEDVNNPYIQLGRVFRADDIADQFMRENGLNNIINQFNNQEYKFFNQYLISKRNVAEGLTEAQSGRKIADDLEVIQRYENDPRFTQGQVAVRDYFKKLSDRMYADGLIDKDLRDYLNEKPDYVPFQRVFDKYEEEIMKAGATGRPVGSISKQNIVYELKGSQRGIIDPLQSAIDYTRKVIKSGEVNKTGQMVGELVKRGGIQGIVARDADKVVRRIALYQDVKQARKLIGALERSLKTRKGWAKDLEREISKLSKEGLDIFFKGRAKEGFQFSDAKTQAKLQRLLDRKQQWLGQLMTETYYDLSPTLDKIAKQAGFDRLTKTQKKELIARLTDQQVSDIIGEITDLSKAKYDRLFNKTLKKNKAITEAMQDIQDIKDGMMLNNVVNGLIRQTPEQLDVIKRQLDRRAPVLEGLLDEVSRLTDEVAVNKEYRNQLMDEARSLGDIDTKNKATISYLKNGVKETLILDKDIVDALKKTNVQNTDLLVKVLSYPSRLLKLGATGINIPFAVADFVRNELGVATYYGLRNSLANPVNLIGAIMDTVGKKGSYEDFLREGVSGGLFTFERGEAKKTVQQIRSQRNIGAKAAYYVDPRNFGDLVKAFENLVQSPNEISRYNVFKNKRNELLKNGVDERNANVQAAEFARQALTDFSRAGEVGKLMEAFFPYFNAGIQGTRAMVSMAKKDPVGFATRFTMYLGVPEFAATAWNISDPERKKAYDDIPQNEKERNFIIILNNQDGGVDRNERGYPYYIAIPKPLQFASLLNIERKLVEGQYAFDSKSVLDVLSNLTKTATSLEVPVAEDAQRRFLASVVPPIARGAVETLTNKNLYTGSDIESPYFAEKGTPEFARYYEDTSYTMKELSKDLNEYGIKISPLKLQNFVKTQLGGTGEQIINTLDYIAYLKGEATEEEVGGKGTGEKLKEVFYKARGGETLRKEKAEEQKAKEIEALAKIGITDAINKGNLEIIGQYTPNITEEQFNNLLDSVAKDQVGDQLTDYQRFIYNKSDAQIEEFAKNNPDKAQDVAVAIQAKETAKGLELDIDTGAFTFKPGSGTKSKAPKIGTFKIKKAAKPRVGGRKRTPARPSLKVPSLRARAKKSPTVKIKASQIKPIKPTRKI